MVHPKLERLLKKTFDIRPGEESRAILMLCYIFLVISSLMIVKPVSTSLFLSKLGASKLPIAFILVAILAAAISTFYSRFLKRVRLHHLIIETLKAAIGSLAILWCLLYFDYLKSWVLYVFYVWVAIFAVTSTSQFWILANQLFNAREAKRLFGFIGAGAIAGGIFGGYLTNFLAPMLGSENMLLVCGGLLSLCIPITKIVWKEHVERENENRPINNTAVEQVVDHPFKLLKRYRHFAYLASIVGVSVVVAKLVEYQFSAIASAKIADEDQLTAFFGFWLSNLNVASLLMQLFLTRRVVGILGVGLSLLFLPAGILVGAIAVLISPALWSAVLIKVNEGSLKQSINKAGMELLALPLPAEIKNQAKSFLDVFVDSLATGVGGLLLIFLTQGLDLSVRLVSVFVVLLLSGWIVLVTRVRREYIHSFRLKIEGQMSSSASPVWDLKNESVIGRVIKILQGEDVSQILHVLKIIKTARHDRFVPCFKKLLRHRSSVIRLEVLRNIYFYDRDFMNEVKPLVNDEDQEIKAEALRYLFQHAPADWQAELLELYLQQEDYLIQGAALLCAARESKDNDELKYIFKIKERVEDALNPSHEAANEERVKFAKMNCAKVIGVANIPDLYPYLHVLLKDRDPEIRKSAILSAGQSANKEFIPILCRNLADEEMYSTARKALMSYGAGIIDILAHFINDPQEHKDIRLSLPKVIATMEIQKSVDVLIQNLAQEDLALRSEVIKALNRLRTSCPPLHFNEYKIASRILDEAEDYLKTLSRLQTEINERVKMHSLTLQARSPIDESKQNLKRLLQQSLDDNLERIFRLLGLIYSPQDIYNAYLGIRRGATDLKVNAVEFLDNVLETNLKKLVIPVAESTMAGVVLDETLHRRREEVSA
jgi:AAA family ATP:ADP antiporter